MNIPLIIGCFIGCMAGWVVGAMIDRWMQNRSKAQPRDARGRFLSNKKPCE